MRLGMLEFFCFFFTMPESEARLFVFVSFFFPELRSCVKEEVNVMGTPQSRIVRTGSVDVKQP